MNLRVKSSELLSLLLLVSLLLVVYHLGGQLGVFLVLAVLAVSAAETGILVLRLFGLLLDHLACLALLLVERCLGGHLPFGLVVGDSVAHDLEGRRILGLGR